MTRHFAALLAVVAISGAATPARAHCDTTNGPVAAAARSALDAGDASLVLHWVRADDEAAVRAAFRQAMEVRALGPAARALADRHFLETLVRLHRAGEGAPYRGLSDAKPEPIIRATDDALDRGSTDELERQLVAAVRAGLAERFAAARTAKSGFRRGDVPAGRQFVAAYVSLTHWAEGVLAAAEAGPPHTGAPGER
jgi:uncharacterized protein DUF6448